MGTLRVRGVELSARERAKMMRVPDVQQRTKATTNGDVGAGRATPTERGNQYVRARRLARCGPRVVCSAQLTRRANVGVTWRVVAYYRTLLVFYPKFHLYKMWR